MSESECISRSRYGVALVVLDLAAKNGRYI